MRLINLIRKWSHRQKEEQDLDQEVHAYLELLTAEKIRDGMTPEAAARSARIELGGTEQVKEQVRDVRSGAWLETVLQDLRYGFRMLLHNPGFSSLIVLTLALGIGANTAIFSVVYGVLLRPLPYQRGGDLVVLHQQATQAHLSNVPFSVKEIQDYRGYNHTLDAVVEYHNMNFLLLGKDLAERVEAGVVSANFFDALGVKPLLGRTFVATDESPNAEPVIILSYQYWQRRHGGDANIVGRVFQMNDRPHTVIGVLPPIPQYPEENDIYMPTTACPTRSSAAFINNRDSRMMTVFGRVKPGVTLATAQADLSAVAGQIETAYPENYPKAYGYGLAAAPLGQDLARRARATLLVLLGAAGFVLLIACANVANLMLARLLKREREFAVRRALGASRVRLMRQLLTEATMLAVAGGALGLMLAPPVLSLLVKFAGQFTTRAAEVKMDAPVLLFTLLLSVGSGLLFGFAPALYSGAHVAETLRQAAAQTSSARKHQRLRASLVMVQVAVSFVLLIGAGLMMRSFVRLQQVDPGFRSDRLLSLRLSPNFNRYQTPQLASALSDNTLRSIRALGGVESAAMTSNSPFSPRAIANGPSSNDFEIEGKLAGNGNMKPSTDVTLVSDRYFETIRQPLLQGRTFTEHDDAETLKAGIINQAMARHRWPTEDPVGKRITFDQGKTWTTIVGVVGDVREYGLDHAPGDEIYLPVKQFGFGSGLVVRTSSDPMSIYPLIRKALHDLDPQLAVDQAETIERRQEESVSSPRITAILLGIFALLALVISASGIAGIMALAVSQRTQELGIRMALGQPRTSLIGMVLRQGLAVSLSGTALGLIGAVALGRLLSSMLYATPPTDAITFATVSLLFVTVATFACLVPARRVTRIDPISALRQE